MLFQKLVGLDVNKQLDLVGNNHVRKKIYKKKEEEVLLICDWESQERLLQRISESLGDISYAN